MCFIYFLDPLSFSVTRRGEETLELGLRNAENMVQDVAKGLFMIAVVMHSSLPCPRQSKSSNPDLNPDFLKRETYKPRRLIKRNLQEE